jgi:hypothetical protein
MTPGAPQAPSSESRIVGRAYAEKAAKVIFSRYPNPKAGPEYLVELTNCLAGQPKEIVDRIADRHLGITFKHKSFAPSIGDVLEMVASLKDMEARYNRYQNAKDRIDRRPRAHTPFRPYPKLWEAFADEPAVLQALDQPESFDWLTEASKRLAMRGKDAARQFIYPQPVDTREVKAA